MNRVRRLLSFAALMAVTVLSFPLTASPAKAGTIRSGSCLYFEETGHKVCNGFLSYWERFGGLENFGFPISEEFQEDGMTVQYFERARFEWHPGARPEHYDVMLTHLGTIRAQQLGLIGTAPFLPVDGAPNPQCDYFPATHHRLCNGFRSFWWKFGGLTVFGYPISEEFQQADGRTVQYFERARFEWHPGVAPARYNVLLGRLGAEVAEAKGLLNTDPFKRQPAPPQDSGRVYGDDYPYKNDPWTQVDPWGFYKRECTSFVAWRMNHQHGINFTNGMNGGHWGNANQWDENARTLGYRVDHTPTPGSIAQWNSGTYGHVAYVAVVSPDGRYVTLEEYNQRLDHNYGTRTIPVSWVENFIHVAN